MKKLILISAVLCFLQVLNAQVVTVAAGKKLQVASTAKYITTVTQMGNNMEVPATSELNYDMEVKSVSDKKIEVALTLKRLKGSTTIMGNEQTFDSEDQAAVSSNPMLAEVFKEVNKTDTVIVEPGKPSPQDDVTGMQNPNAIAGSLFIPVGVALVKEGYAWADSLTSGDSKVANTYIITKVTPEEITISSVSNNQLVTTRQQAGIEVKVDMQAAGTATLVYNAATGVLKNATKTFTASGTNEAMGNVIPVSIKGSAVITVN